MRSPQAGAQVADRDPRDHNLYQRKNGGTWHIRYELSGEERRESLRTTDVRQARKARDIILKQIENKRAGVAPPPVHTWQEAVEGALADMERKVKTKSMQPQTLERYKTSLAMITLALGWTDDDRPIPLESITTGTVMDFVRARIDADRSVSTVLNDITAWSRVAVWAKKNLGVDNPVLQIDRAEDIGKRASDIEVPPTDKELLPIVEEVGEWLPEMATLMRWLRNTGMRLGEALNSRRDDIQPGGYRMTLRRATKRGKVRTILLSPIAREMLVNMPNSGRLFPGLRTESEVVSTRYGQWCRQRQGREKEAASQAGREAVALDRWRLHDLRHAYACSSLTDDPDCIYRLSGQLGHTKVGTTEIYTKHIGGHGALWRYGRLREVFASLIREDTIPAEA